MTDVSGRDGVSRRDFLHGGAMGALGLSSAALLAACGGTHAATAGTTSATSTGPTGGSAVKGGTLRVGLVSAGSAETIDVRKALNFPDYVRLFNLLDPLFFAAPGGLVTPGLCQAAHPNKDATVWTLELRPGVEWQDGIAIHGRRRHLHDAVVAHQGEQHLLAGRLDHRLHEAAQAETSSRSRSDSSTELPNSPRPRSRRTRP